MSSNHTVYCVHSYYDYRKEVEFRLLGVFRQLDAAYSLIQSQLAKDYEPTTYSDWQTARQLRLANRQLAARQLELEKLLEQSNSTQSSQTESETEAELSRLESEQMANQAKLDSLDKEISQQLILEKVIDDQGEITWLIDGSCYGEYVSPLGKQVICDLGTAINSTRYCIIADILQ